VELKAEKSPGERDAALQRNDEEGPRFGAAVVRVADQVRGSRALDETVFPGLGAGCGYQCEVNRVATIKFAEGGGAQEADPSEEAVARRKPVPTTVPNDTEAIALLTDGEKRVAERNPRAAETSFRKVLAKYPDQIRAWYGLGMVALMDHDGPRAKEVFGRLTAGEHAATQDPMVLAWSHIYLGRIYDGDGEQEHAKTEFQAALDVQGGPDQARQAPTGLVDVANEKPVARP
jgi:hypothetical protein